MCDEWLPTLQYRLAPDEFRSLPRNSAYKYEYSDGTARLTPRARHFHAVLDLSGYQPGPVDLSDVQIRPMRSADRAPLQRVFAWSFDDIQPFGSLSDERRHAAAQACLDKTWEHRDGPRVEEASFVAALEESDAPIGAVFITLLPGGDPSAWDSYYWTGAPPADCLLRRAGQPHLTWIFMAPVYARRGLGTALLTAAARALIGLGYASLWSTFLDGNVASMLWHWRNGFDLAAHPGSRRRKT